MKSEKYQKNKRWGLRHDRHSVSMLTDHMVFCTKFRRPLLYGDIAIRCEEIIRDVAKQLDVKIIRMAVNPEHVHIFFKFPPKLSLSKISMQFKGTTSYKLRKEFPELKKDVKKHLWAPSNYHGSVGQGFDVVENYIKSQDDHHRR
jgi:putative transposase